MALSEKAKLNVQAVLVLVVAVVAVVLVPHARLLPVAVGVGVVVGLALLGLRAYVRRLEAAVRFLAAAGNAKRAGGLVALLSEPERKLLRVGDVTDIAATIALLKDRQEAVVAFGVYLGVVGIAAAIAVIVALEA